MDSPYTTQSGRELTLSERFQILAAQKMQKASEMTAEDAAKRAEALRNNRIIQLYAYLRGDNIDGEPLEDELALLEYPEDELTVDENGRLCLKKDLEKRKKEEAETAAAAEAAKQNAAANAPDGDAESDADAGDDGVFSAAAEQRRMALRNANRALRGLGGDDDDEDGVEAPESSESPAEGPQGVAQSDTANIPAGGAEMSGDTEEPEEDAVPVNEDATVLRLEDINFTEARVYISVAENPAINEQAFGVFVEQGYGMSRHVFVYGERMRGSNLETMAYRAASVALDAYQRVGQPIHEVTIFIERDLGWALSQNSWSLAGDIYGHNIDAELYSNKFRACAAANVRIRIAPAKAAGYGQAMADTIAETLVTAPI